MIMNLHEPNATALIGVDLARNDRRRTSAKPRVMKGVAVVGSTAVEDFYVGRFYNTHAGVIQVDTISDTRPVGPHFIPAGSSVAVICVANATGNPVNISIL